MGRTSLKLCLFFLPFLALIREAQGEIRPNTRSYSYDGDKLESKSEAEEARRAGDGLILAEAEATSSYASSRGGDLNLDQHLTKAEGRGGPIYAFFTDDLRNRRANANIVTQFLFTTVGWIGMYFAWPLLRGSIAAREDTASIFNPLLFDVGGFADEKKVTRQGDDSDMLSILDFNFTLDQVLARVATNIGWTFLNLLLWGLFGKLPDVAA